MWVVTKEGWIVIGVVALVGLLGLVLLLQPKEQPTQSVASAQPVAPLVQTVVVPPPVDVRPGSVIRPVTAIDGIIYADEYAHSTEATGFEIHWSNDAHTLRVGLISPGL